MGRHEQTLLRTELPRALGVAGCMNEAVTACPGMISMSRGKLAQRDPDSR